MRTVAATTLAVATVATALVRTRRSHRASGRATTVRTRFVLVLAPLVFAMFGATSSALACVVGTGTRASCTEAALDACLPGGGSFDGTVTFACGGAATITVTSLSSPKTISANTTIDGGSLITISGGGTVQAFIVNSGVTFTVQNLTIANGGNGCVIENGGTLNVTDSTFSGNFGAIGNVGTLSVTNSSFSGNGLGNFGSPIRNAGTATVTNCTFSNNGDGFGVGAIDNSGTLTVTNSTFSGNHFFVGAIDNEGGMVTVTNSTFSFNTSFAIAQILGRGGRVSVTNSTFALNAIYNTSGTTAVTNSIVANLGATASAGRSCVGAVDAVIDGGHNIDDGTTCGFGGTNCFHCVGGDFPGRGCSADSDCTGTPPTVNGTCAAATGTSFCNTNPLFDPTGLTSNGGPTQTIALGSMSPAINAGNETICAAPPVNNLDQRGFVRPGMGATNCSIGAYEFNAAPPTLPGCAGFPCGDDEVSICHVPPGNPRKSQALCVGLDAVAGHLNHGDHCGPCGR